jgi:hypothetical protein
MLKFWTELVSFKRSSFKAHFKIAINSEKKLEKEPMQVFTNAFKKLLEKHTQLKLQSMVMRSWSKTQKCNIKYSKTSTTRTLWRPNHFILIESKWRPTWFANSATIPNWDYTWETEMGNPFQSSKLPLLSQLYYRLYNIYIKTVFVIEI